MSLKSTFGQFIQHGNRIKMLENNLGTKNKNIEACMLPGYWHQKISTNNQHNITKQPEITQLEPKRFDKGI